MKTKIEYFVIIGDSLSDKGQMAASMLSPFAGLKGYSPDGRFTNGFTWDDFFCDEVFKEKNSNSTIKTSDDKRVTTNTSQAYVRTYCIGGLTSYAYDKEFRINPYYEATDLVLSNLDEQRVKIQADDRNMIISEAQKQKTLVIEWSGANDLITVNSTPTTDAAEKAIQARIENLNKMIRMGYRHFVLFNLPNLSLTPRFQNGAKEERDHANTAVIFFNERLTEEIEKIKNQQPDCIINFYDVNQMFTAAYNNPEVYDLDEDKKHSPLIKSQHFQNTNDPAAAKGYMFWDEVHPTEAVHAILANDFNHNCFEQHYIFQVPEETLLRQFREAYGLQWSQDKEACFGFFKQSRIKYREADLETILMHALYEGGHRTNVVIRGLGWIDQNKQCSSEHTSIITALENVEAQLILNNNPAESQLPPTIQMTSISLS